MSVLFVDVGRVGGWSVGKALGPPFEITMINREILWLAVRRVKRICKIHHGYFEKMSSERRYLV